MLTLSSFSYLDDQPCVVNSCISLPFAAAGTDVEVQSFSAGFLPAWIPLSFLWNMLFFWVPFWDHGNNQRRVAAIRESMQLALAVEKQGRSC